VAAIARSFSVRPTVLIVDDHAAFRASATALLRAEGFDVIGECADGEQAVEAVQRLHPDVVLLDVQLPGLDGFSTAALIAEIADGPAVVLISSRTAADYGARVIEAMVCGFLVKSELSGVALRALIA
jgi:DNA-binding NarL/FixJ family response regulator